ncbi:hypothetical protein [Gilliamella apis]|uniref:Uncharacterized protein n=1 Tax=Gilliamella apis TaxID=1970738 RepID=A0A242NWU5_9GAMM|nr:hypothetical protein [Gilliamella apis]OTQ52720.1 hypothetical protein B6D06_01735 [Gilliamella apis]
MPSNFYRARPSKVNLPEAEAGRAVNQCTKSSVVVEFRPLNNWDGEFGFDWLRLTEAEARDIEQSYIRNADNQVVAFSPNNPTFGLVESGFATVKKDLDDAKAQKKIQKEYKTFSISDKGRVSQSRHLTYYVPYLNLYPQAGLSPLKALTKGLTEYATTEPRPCEAKLRMIADIKGQSPESIEIEFNNKDFAITLNIADAETEIDGEITSLKIPVPKNYTPTPDTAATSRKLVAGAIELIVTITCLRSLSSNKEINVYAYHEQDSTKLNKKAREDLEKINKQHNKANPGDPNDPTTVILTNQKLAGKLIVLQNDAHKQKELNVILIIVQTEVDVGATKKGSYHSSELKKLSNVLHHALVHPRLITKLNSSEIVLDLTSDNNFKKVLPDATKPRGLNNGYYIYPSGKININEASFSDYIYDKFINTEIKTGKTITKPYQNLTRANGYFLVFSFADKALNGSVIGNVLIDKSKNFLKSVALYGNLDRANNLSNVFAHEAYHGIQLRHTHRDETPLKHPNCKYIFPHRGYGIMLATSNIMSYNAGTYAYSTWHWQWEIMQKNV